MRAIVKNRPGPGADLSEVAEPAIVRADEVLVKPQMTAICGTDYHVYAWDAWSAARVRPPRVMGHEFAGVVLATGTDVRRVKTGDYVTGESHLVCGQCLQCRTGQAHVCAHTRIHGVDVDGCFAETLVVPESSLWQNPPHLPREIAVIQDPLGNAVHAVMAGEIAATNVLVLGCGPIGLMAIAVARACGAAQITATDTQPYRLRLADQLGADTVVNVTHPDADGAVRRASPNGFDVALEMSGAPSAVRTALRATRRGGRVALMGIPTTPVELDVAEDMVFRGLRIDCIVGRRLYETWATMSALLGSGRLDISPVVTHQLPFEEIDRGMSLMRQGLCGKVVLHME